MLDATALQRALQAVDPSYRAGTCDGTRTDPRCPAHGEEAPWAGLLCTGRRYWTCERCNAFTSGTRCINCGRGAPLRIFDADSEGFAEDALRRMRPAAEAP